MAMQMAAASVEAVEMHASDPRPPLSVGAARVRVADVEVRQRRRGLGDVAPLVDSIREIGMLNPIVITRDRVLVSGRHRLEACRQLGREWIEATVVDLDDLRTELAEIDENVVRRELSVLERAESLARRKRIYETLHPETKWGGTRGRSGGGKVARAASGGLCVPSYAADVSARTGMAERTVRQLVQIAEDIPADLRELLRETPAADRPGQLLAIARARGDLEEQRRLATSAGRRARAATDPAAHDEDAARRRFAALIDSLVHQPGIDATWQITVREDREVLRALADSLRRRRGPTAIS